MNKTLFKAKKSEFSNCNFIPSVWEIPEDKTMCNSCGCDSTNNLLSALVRKMIQDNVRDSKIFSAWDITKKIRGDVGPDVNILHGDVREVVNDWFETAPFKNDWSRTLINLTNGKVTYVYHPLTTLAENYPGFAGLVETMKVNEPCNPWAGCPTNDDCRCAEGKDGFDYEESFDDLLEVAFGLYEAVEEFIDGEITISELSDEMVVFDENVEKISKKIEESN